MEVLGKHFSKYSEHELIDIYLFYKRGYESTGIEELKKISDNIMAYLNSLKNKNIKITNKNKSNSKFVIDDDLTYLKINTFDGCYNHYEYTDKCYYCLYNKYLQLLKMFHVITDYLLECIEYENFNEMINWLDAVIDKPELTVNLAKEIKNRYIKKLEKEE